MYDIFIDEEKTQGYIGFLVTQNTPALQQLLFRRREAQENYRREIKYVTVNNTSIHVVLPWLNIFFGNDFCCYFFYRKWNGKVNQKRNIITKAIEKIKELTNTKKNLVAFMDLDSNHQNLNIQNQIRENAKIMRCYHLDSKSFDMLQLCDVLLQCAIKSEDLKFDSKKYNKLLKRMQSFQSLKKPELKRLIVYHAIRQNRYNKKLRKRIAPSDDK